MGCWAGQSLDLTVGDSSWVLLCQPLCRTAGHYRAGFAVDRDYLGGQVLTGHQKSVQVILQWVSRRMRWSTGKGSTYTEKDFQELSSVIHSEEKVLKKSHSGFPLSYGKNADGLEDKVRVLSFRDSPKERCHGLIYTTLYSCKR